MKAINHFTYGSNEIVVIYTVICFQIREAKQKEKDEATKKYLEKKRENYKKISAKTKWGQPVMKGRMEILLERIQKSVNTDVIK